MIPSSVELGEPYVYAHWLEKRGIMAVRNPSNESREFVLDLGKTGAPGELTDAICYTQYPYRRGIASGLTGHSQILLKLAPWELLFLEIVVRSQLKETVAIGARWYRESDDTMSIIPDRGVGNIRIFEPGKDNQVIAVVPREPGEISGQSNSFTVRQVPEKQWLAIKRRTYALFPFKYPMEPTPETMQQLKEAQRKNVEWKKIPTMEFEVNGSVTVPLKSYGQILLLVEFPGRDHCQSSCEGWIDDRQVKLEEKSSEEHIGFFNWTGDLRPFESEWCWYICNLPGGSHRFNFRGTAGHPNPRFGLWVWADSELTDRMRLVSIRCSDPAMPQYLPHLERQGVCLVPPKNNN